MPDQSGVARFYGREFMAELILIFWLHSEFPCAAATAQKLAISNRCTNPSVARSRSRASWSELNNKCRVASARQRVGSPRIGLLSLKYFELTDTVFGVRI